MRTDTRTISLPAWVKRALHYCLLASCIWLLSGCEELSPQPTPTPLPTRALAESSLNLAEQWRFRTGPPYTSDSSPPHIFVADGKVIISYGAGQRYGDEDHASWLTALSLETGQIVWQTRLKNQGGGTDIDSARLDEEKLYLAYSFRVHAFSLETGQLLWSTSNLGTHTGYDFRPWDPYPPLLVYSSLHNEMIAIDPATGEVLSRQEDSGELIQWGQIEFLRTNAGLYAMDRQTGAVIWERPLMRPANRQILPWPIFVGNDMVFEADDPVSKIVRANVESGQVAWETEQAYISNFAQRGSRLYALRQDASLVALDLESGETMGAAQFTGPATRPGSDVYWVVTAGEYVLVFFSDSRELIVLKETAAQSSNNPPFQTDEDHLETAPLDDQESINLEVGDKQVSITISQHGQNIPLVDEQGTIQLEPKPFSLHLYGDTELVSLMTLKDLQLFAPLEQTTRPVVVFEGTSNAWDDFDTLFVHGEPLELYEGTGSFFVNEWGESPERAVELSSHLERQLGSAPTILTTGRYYLAAMDDTSSLTVHTIDGAQMQAGESILLVVFLEDPIGETFSQVKWLKLAILF